MAMADFAIEGVPLKNFRFRAYDSVAKVKMQPYDQWEKTLMQLVIKSHIKLIIEMKKEDEEFEVYNPDLLKLKTLLYTANKTYDFKKMDTLECDEIEINRKEQTVADLEETLAEMYGIPKDSLVIFLRHVQFNNQVKGEIYNMPWRKPKKIEDCSKFDHGSYLFIEEGDIKAKMETLQWHQEFMKEMDKIHVNVNDPTQDPLGTVFAVKVEMRKHNTLREFKEKIGQLFDLKIHEFTVKRMMVNRELKNLELKLSELGVSNNSNIIVEIGKAHQEGIFELKISMIKLNTVAVQDEVLFDKEHLFKLLIEP